MQTNNVFKDYNLMCIDDLWLIFNYNCIILLILYWYCTYSISLFWDNKPILYIVISILSWDNYLSSKIIVK